MKKIFSLLMSGFESLVNGAKSIMFIYLPKSKNLDETLDDLYKDAGLKRMTHTEALQSDWKRVKNDLNQLIKKQNNECS